LEWTDTSQKFTSKPLAILKGEKKSLGKIEKAHSGIFKAEHLQLFMLKQYFL